MLSSKINHQIFFDNIKQALSQNISEKVIASLADLIALDYDIRLKDKFSEIEYIKIVIRRLKLFLNNRVIDDNDFSTVLTLFIRAITPESSDGALLDRNQNIEIIVDMLIASYFQEYEKSELTEIKLILTNIINDLGIDKVFKFVTANVNVVKSYINSNLQKNTQQIDLPKLSKSISALIDRTNLIENKINNFKQAAAKISLTFGALSIAALAVFSSSIIIPALLIPTLILTIKTAPRIGALIGKTIIKTDRSIRAEIKNISLIKRGFNLSQNIKKLLNHNIIAKQQKAPEIEKQISHLKNNPENYYSKQFAALRPKQITDKNRHR